MESSSDAENVEGQLGVIWGQILTDSCMEVKLGGWNRRPMPTILAGLYLKHQSNIKVYIF